MDIEQNPKKSEMACIDFTGDTKIMWSKDSEDEVEAAKATFDKLKKKGYSAYRVEGKDGAQGELIHTFDPKAERIIMVPPMKAG